MLKKWKERRKEKKEKEDHFEVRQDKAVEKKNGKKLLMLYVPLLKISMNCCEIFLPGQEFSVERTLHISKRLI